MRNLSCTILFLMGICCLKSNPSLAQSQLNPDVSSSGQEANFNNRTHYKSAVESEKIWLNLYNDQGAFSQILIGFIEGATNGYDRDFDGYRFFSGNPVVFYSLVDDIKLAIQGRAPRSLEEETVPLGVSVEIEEAISLSISIDELEGAIIDASIDILLEDKMLNVYHDLKSAPYQFVIENSGSYDSRFNLIIKDLGVLDIENNIGMPEIIISAEGNDLRVKTSGFKPLKISIHDALGRKLAAQEPSSDESNFTFNTPIFNNLLLVTIVFDNGLKMFKKIILHQ